MANHVAVINSLFKAISFAVSGTRRFHTGARACGQQRGDHGLFQTAISCSPRPLSCFAVGGTDSIT